MTLSSPSQLPHISLTSVSIADIPYLKSVEDDPDVGPYIRPWSPDEHAAGLSNDSLLYFLALEARTEQPAGFIILRHHPEAPHTIEFVRLAIARRGEGLGRAAIRAVLEFATSQQLASVWLEVFPNNSRALAVYKKEGFVEVSRSHSERGYGGLPGEVIRMETTVRRA